MTEAAVRSSIKTLIEGVSNAGKVYDRLPLLTTWDQFLEFFQVNVNGFDQIRGFTITCQAIERLAMVTTGLRDTGNKANYSYTIRGYNSFNYDRDTENTFLALVISVMDTLDGGITTTTVYPELAQLEVYEPRIFGDTLCHYAEITQVVMEVL